MKAYRDGATIIAPRRAEGPDAIGDAWITLEAGTDEYRMWDDWLRSLGSTVEAAAGVDTHPGGEQLKHWWVYGAGAARWATFTELYHQLREEIEGKSDNVVKAIAASWFHLRFGYWPGDHRNVHASESVDDEGDEWEEAIAALVAALAELSGVVSAAAGGDFDILHPRGKGGRFRTTVDRLKDAIQQHRTSGGKGDPFTGYDREQLRRAAKTRGITLGRGEDRDSIAKKLLDDLAKDEPVVPEAKPAPAPVVEAPKKAPVKRAPRKRSAAPPADQPGPGMGRDLTAARGFSADMIASSASFQGDKGIAAIAHRQGFDGLPRVASKADVDKLVHSGGRELFRGVEARGDRTAAEITELFRSGPAFYGSGLYGNGIYLGDRDTAEGYAEDYGRAPGSVARMVLSPDARTIGYDSLLADWKHYRQEHPAGTPEHDLYSGPSRYAAALGYDAVVDNPEGTVVLLNRTAVTVESADGVPGKPTVKRAPRKTAEPKPARAPAKRAPAKAAKPKPAGRATGRDMIAGGGDAELARQVSADAGSYKSADPKLASIAAKQGFDGPPRVVSRSEMDRLTQDQEPLYRGVFGHHGRSAAEIHEQTRTGPAWYGNGIFGNGIYFAVDQQKTEYYSDRTPGSMLRAVLDPAANVISYADLKTALRDFDRKMEDDDPRWPVFSDPGRLAAALGYDAIRVPLPQGEGGDQLVVLNRTAMLVEEAG